MFFKKSLNNFFLITRKRTLTLISILTILFIHRKNIKEQTMEISLNLSIIHNLLIKRIIKERPRYRYLRNKKIIKISTPVGPFIFSNPQTRAPKILKLLKVLLSFQGRVRGYQKEILSHVFLFRQVKPRKNIFPSLKMQKKIKALPITMNQALLLRIGSWHLCFTLRKQEDPLIMHTTTYSQKASLTLQEPFFVHPSLSLTRIGLMIFGRFSSIHTLHTVEIGILVYGLR